MSGNRDEYIEKLKAKLDEWGVDIEKLQSRAGEMAATARKECDEQISNLRVRRQDLEKKLRVLAGEAETAWKDMKVGIDAAADALGAAVKAARTRFSATATSTKK